MNRNAGISLLRVCSMLMIVLCHVCNYLNLSWLGQFLNVGVYVFLLISGWLYSNREINHQGQWLLKRWEKLCIPILVWVACVTIYSYLRYHEFPALADVILFISNLQGLSWIILPFPQINNTGVLGGLGNLWFVTAIFLCYILLILVKQCEQKGCSIRLIPTGIISFIAFVVLAYLKINIVYFICFFIGYTLGKTQRLLDKKSYLALTGAMITAIIVRLIVKGFFDDTTTYNVVVVGLTHTVIAIWIFYTVLCADNHISLIHKLAQTKIISRADNMSYFIYITHNFFLVQKFGLKELVPGLLLQIIVFAALSISTAFLIRWISGNLQRIMTQK